MSLQQHIETLSEQLFEATDQEASVKCLLMIGAEIEPILLERLNDPRAGQVHFGEQGWSLDARSPLGRICRLLEKVGSEVSVEPLARFLNNPLAEHRQEVALVLGSLGFDSCTAPLCQAFADNQQQVVKYALIGLKRSIENDRASERMLQSVFPQIISLLRDHRRNTDRLATEILLMIAPVRATQELLTPPIFSIENRNLRDLLAVMNAQKIGIDRFLLDPLLTLLMPQIQDMIANNDYPSISLLANLLVADAIAPNESTRSRLESAVRLPADRIQSAAAEGLGILTGISDPDLFVLKKYELSGFDPLTIPQRHYYAVMIYNIEVTNGGHSQYFLNHEGLHLEWAVGGLQAIGAIRRAELLQQGIAIFLDEALAKDNDAWFNALASIDWEYSEIDEKIEFLLFRYAANHASDFQ